MERSKAGTKKRRPDGVIIYSSGLPSQGLQRSEAVDELSNQSTPVIHPLPPAWGG